MKRNNLKTDRWHGRIILEGRKRGTRWCEQHQSCHAILYPCKYYPIPLRNKLHKGWKGIANDPEWIHWQTLCVLRDESPTSPFGRRHTPYWATTDPWAWWTRRP